MDLGLVVLGNPEGRRVAGFQAALLRHGLRPARVVAYQEALRDPDALRLALRKARILRIESPGEDPIATRELLRWGANEALPPSATRVPHDRCDVAELDPTQVLAPAQWMAGYQSFLSSVAKAVAAERAGVLTPPRDIVAMTDKRECGARLASLGVPTPVDLGAPKNFAQLRNAMVGARTTRAFLKLRWGSSASGVVALRLGEGRARATTTVEMISDASGLRLHNSLRVRTYRELADIRRLVDALCAEGSVLQRWIPKESDERGRVFDLRVLMVGGEPAHVVVRTSRSPITNLHLGNARGDVKSVMARIGATSWGAIERTCRRAAAAFPGSLQVACDVIVARGGRSHAIVEMNAFGDLLPGVQWQGVDTYGAQVRSLCAGWRGLAA